MRQFQPGERYDLVCSAYPRWGDVVGWVEIVSVNRIPEEDLNWRRAGIKDCYDAEAGTITYIIHSERHNLKPKTATLICTNNSEEYAKKCTHGIRRGEWFCPTKRSYQCISTQ